MKVKQTLYHFRDGKPWEWVSPTLPSRRRPLPYTAAPPKRPTHSARPVVSDRVQEKMINACPAERNEKHGTGRWSPHFWRGKQGQESKEKQSRSPQIHYGVKLSHKHAPVNQNEPHHSDTKCIQTLKWHMRGVTFSFFRCPRWVPYVPPHLGTLGRGRHVGLAASVLGIFRAFESLPGMSAQTGCSLSAQCLL